MPKAAGVIAILLQPRETKRMLNNLVVLKVVSVFDHSQS